MLTKIVQKHYSAVLAYHRGE